MEGWLLYLHLSCYALVLARLPMSRHQWNTALMLSMGVATAVVIIGNVIPGGRQLTDHRLIATIGNPSMLSGYLLLNLFLIPYLSTQYQTTPYWRKNESLRSGGSGAVRWYIPDRYAVGGTGSASGRNCSGGVCSAVSLQTGRLANGRISGWIDGVTCAGVFGCPLHAPVAKKPGCVAVNALFGQFQHADSPFCKLENCDQRTGRTPPAGLGTGKLQLRLCPAL